MRVFNFAAGPATLPLPVLEQVQAELPDWQGRGMSVMEVSHRGKAFIRVAEEAEADLRELLDVPGDYKVLFLQGGAQGQFAAIPMNLATWASTVDYVDTGHWSKRALDEARTFCGRVAVVADAKASGYASVPPVGDWRCSPDAAYLHYTPNETIGGVEFPFIPDVGNVPLVADFSSSILSRPLDVTRFGLVYASAQKNIGPAGLAIVIVREDLAARARPATPTIWNYGRMAAAGSMANTPPTFSWYVAGLVFKWLKREGGLAAMADRNQAKAAKLYAAIDASGFYDNPVDPACRSRMNVPFTLASPELGKAFLEGAEQAGLANLAGHRSVGGMRASLYNAMPMAGVEALVSYMQEFERRNG